jgi:hypothetical protein
MARSEHTRSAVICTNPQHAPKVQDKTPNAKHRWRQPFEVPYGQADRAISDDTVIAIMDFWTNRHGLPFLSRQTVK